MQRYGQNHELAGPSSTVLPTEYEAMLQDVASHMSRSEMLRRLSTHSSSTSGSSKRGSIRVTKNTSATNSPINVQRRRTTASHSSRSHPRNSQENAYQTREQRLRDYYGSKHSAPFARPMSWHPGSDAYPLPCSALSTNEPALGNTIADLKNLAVSGTPQSSIQQSIQNAFAMGYGFPNCAPSTMYNTSPAETQAYGMLDNSPDAAGSLYPTYSVSDPLQYPYPPQAFPQNVYPADYHPSQQWPQNTSYLAMPSQIPQARVDSQFTQATMNSTRVNKTVSAPGLSRRKSKELVGMGLYDDRSIRPAFNVNPSQDSQGKGLKLEETWQPPNDDEEEEDDEGYSTDEAEEVEEVPPPIMPSNPAEAPSSLYPNYGDMSNQSFFFNDDDEYVNDDHYANYLAYGQALPESQPKPQPNAPMQNYLWF